MLSKAGQPVLGDPNNIYSLESKHEDSINDCSFDYYGTQLVSCDSNGLLQFSGIRLDGTQEDIQTIKAHDGPVWQVAWAHPKFESVVASCGYDKKVKVWRKDQNQNWQNLIFQETLSSSVNCIAWAPFEYGLILAAGTADGKIYIFSNSKKEGQWTVSSFVGHTEGVNGVCWSPSTMPTSQLKASLNENKLSSLPPKRLVSGGSDKLVKVWEFNESELNPSGSTIGAHDDWVRDVSWNNNTELQYDTIASCSEDKTCKIWKHDQKSKETAW